MRNVSTVIKGFGEGRAMDIIFDACRANPDRQERTVRLFTVTFKAFGNCEHLAEVRDGFGIVATAIVDQFDN